MKCIHFKPFLDHLQQQLIDQELIFCPFVKNMLHSKISIFISPLKMNYITSTSKQINICSKLEHWSDLFLFFQVSQKFIVQWNIPLTLKFISVLNGQALIVAIIWVIYFRVHHTKYRSIKIFVVRLEISQFECLRVDRISILSDMFVPFQFNAYGIECSRLIIRSLLPTWRPFFTESIWISKQR